MKTKKLIGLLLAVATTVNVCAKSFVATTTGSDGVIYTLYDDYTATVTGYSSATTYSSTVGVSVKARVSYNARSYTVTEIGNNAFTISQKVRSITLPNTIKKIGNWAFAKSIITSVNIQEGVESIGERAFYSSSITSLTIPSTVTELGNNIVENCSSLQSIAWNTNHIKDYESADKAPFYDIRNQITSFTFAASVDTIPAYLCYEMEGVTSLELPTATALQIGAYAFYGLNRVKQLTLKRGTNAIGEQAFAHWDALEKIFCYSYSIKRGGNVFYDAKQSDVPMFVANETARTALVNQGWDKEFEYIIHNFPYQVVATSNNEALGTVQVTQALNWDQTEATIVATPSKGSQFVRWSDGNTDNPRTIDLMMDWKKSDWQLVAYFEKGWDGYTSLKPAGEGTDQSPYLITSAEELYWYKNEVDQNRNHYAIIDVDTISLGGHYWQPIGSENHPFKGHFDGRNHYISNFKVTGGNYQGLFGVVGYNYSSDDDVPTIENVKLCDATVSGSDYVGVLCGWARYSHIIACDNYATVHGGQYVGSICGYITGGKIRICVNEGEVHATGDYAGGVAGYISNATVDACVNNKSVSSSGQYVGGVAGKVEGSSSTITGCNSAAEATVSGTKYVGGLCGNVTEAAISNSSNYGAVYASNQEAGGLIGTLDGATASYLYNYGRVTSTSSQVGGVIGSTKNNSSVSCCANAGYVNATNDQNIGGLIGNASATNILACVNIGVIRGKNYTGGLVGYHYENSRLTHCINYGPVSGADRVGGITGEARALMQECISTGHVSGTGTNVGGISGLLLQPSFASLCLFDSQLCPLDKAFGSGNGDGEGITTAELTGNVDGLDFTAWTMGTGYYPRVTNLASLDISAAGASVVTFADDDDADNFSKQATLTVLNRSKWSSKGGTQISGTTAKPAIIGPDTLYVTKTNAVKAVPVNVIASSIPSYTLTIKAGEHGRVDNEGGKFAEGTEVTVTAIPDDKYQFAQWNDGNKNNPRTFVVTKDETYTAQFEKIPLPKYQVTVTPGQGGTVNNVSGEYEEGTELTLIATPDAGWRFVRWSDGNTDNPRTLVVTEAVTLSAEFEEIPPQQFTIAISAGEGGSVNSSEINGTYNEGTELTLIATPADNDHFFIKWSDGNTDNPRTLVLTSDTTLSAEFGAIPYYSLTISAGPGGTVNDTVNRSYREGSEVIIEAKPNEDYVFIKWSDGVDLSRRTIVITSDTVLRAEFVAIEYFDLVVKADEGGTVNDTVNGRYRTGDKVYIEAKPKDDDHRFTGWSDGVKTNPRTITITADSTIIAHFEAIPYYTLTVIAGEGGTVDESVNKSYREGIEVTIKATPDEDHTFLQWSDGNTDNPRTITMTEDKTLEAQFSEIVRLEVWIGTAVGGTVNTDAGGRYEEGTTITLQATPDRGYVFDHWSDGSKANPYNYTVPATDVVIYPVFYQTNCVQ